MASKIKLLNSEGTTLTVSNSDLLLQDKDVIYLDTVEQLTNASGSNGDVAHVSDLDRGGVFVYDSTSTDNQGTVFGSWVRQYEGAVNVKWFGAKGDGVADDTIAIQSAIESISIIFTGKRRIFIPSGAYLVSSSLDLNRSNMVFFGASAKTTIIKTKDNSADLVTGLLNIESNNIEIHGLTIDGNNSTNQFFNSGIYGLATSGIIVHDCVVQNTGQNGIQLNADTTPNSLFNIYNNKVINTGWRGIEVVYGTDGTISGNDIRTTASHGICVTQGADALLYPCQRVLITDNKVDRSGVPSFILVGGIQEGFLICIGAGSVDIQVTDNFCNNNIACVDDGIGIAESGVAPHYRILIANNIVNYAGAYGIDVTNECTCIGNRVAFAGTSGIHVGQDTGNIIKNVVIADNVITDPCHIGFVGAGAQAGIRVRSGVAGAQHTNIQISGNIVKDDTAQCSYGVWLDSTNTAISDVIISDNNIKNVQVKSIQIDGSQVSDVYTNNNILGGGNVQILEDSATPSVLGANMYLSTSTVSITNLLNGHTGQLLLIQATQTQTIVASGTMALAGGLDFNMNVSDTLQLVRQANGVWYELSRSSN